MTAAELSTEIARLTATGSKRVSIFIAKLKNNRSTHPARKRLTKSEFIVAINESHRQIFLRFLRRADTAYI